MPGPLSGLKKATSIGPDPNPPGHPEDDYLGTGIQGLLGAFGLGDPESQANRGGQLVSAAAPIVSGSVKIPGILREIFAKDPGAQEVYERAMASQLAEVGADRIANRASRYGRAAEAHDALLDLDVADRPRPIPSDTGWEIAIPLQPGRSAPVSGQRGPGPSLGTQTIEGPSYVGGRRVGGTPAKPVRAGAARQAAPGFESKFSTATDAEAAVKALKEAPRLVKKPK